jgi:hypothetical protein
MKSVDLGFSTTFGARASKARFDLAFLAFLQKHIDIYYVQSMFNFEKICIQIYTRRNMRNTKSKDKGIFRNQNHSHTLSATY